MTKCSEKFLLLMWKNFLLQWRHPIQTAVEILAPMVFVVLLVVFRGLAYHEERAAKIYTRSEIGINYVDNITIAWSPNNPKLQTIIDDMAESIENQFIPSSYRNLSLKHTGLQNSKALETYLLDIVDANTSRWGFSDIIVGIQFDDSLAKSTELPSRLNISLRYPAERSKYSGDAWGYEWLTESLFPKFQMNAPRNEWSDTGSEPEYIDRGFLFIQKEISYSIINYLKNLLKNENFHGSSAPLYIQRFPNARYTNDDILFAFQFMIPSFVMFSFLYTCISTVKVITIEKERQLKETMKIMGLPGWLHWTAWFIKTFIMFFISITLMTIFMTVKWFPDTDLAIFTHSNPVIIFLLFLLYSLATITYCFLISVFFSKANTAAIIAGVIWFISFSPFSNLQAAYDSLGLAEKLISCIFSNSAMGYGFQIVLMYEGLQEGAQWDNIWEPAKSGDQLVLGHIFIMLLVDAILYFLLTIYIEGIFPGEYGVPQVWYFPFTASYWCGNTKQMRYEGNIEESKENKYFEKEPTHLKVGIKIQNLRKEFSKDNVAVKNLTLNLYQDQITVLLGHNGAGKTTTMSMLTGMIPPSSGTAVVAGHDIHEDIAGVRDSLGLCPQHNILFDDLTVREHLYFYNRLKGLDKAETEKEIENLLEIIELTDKGNAQSSTLSGGMKRKLSVTIALCGNSSVVMCDEPTSGMDPSARRALWDLLRTQKKGRTILLTTHFMDEADILGDRIAIMSGGELQCCGSSYYLKKAYGAGYRLIMDKRPDCEVERVTGLLGKYIPDIKVDSCIGSELTYVLNEDKSSIFQEMLFDLETNSKLLGITSYGISITNFDEVFMKVTTSHHELNNNEPNDSDLKKSNETKLNINDQSYAFLTGYSLWWNQVVAMLMKRSLSILRSWIVFLLQNLIPVVSVFIIIVVIRNVGVIKDPPALEITLDSYNDPITTLNKSSNNQYAQAYIDMLKSESRKIIDWEGRNLIREMLAESLAHWSTVRMRYIIGASFWENNSIVTWFNNEPYHSKPLTVQAAINSVLKKEVSKDHSIQFTNHPLPFSASTKLRAAQSDFGSALMMTMNLSFALSLVSAFYVMFYVRERVNNVKHLQFVSGVRVTAFWLSSFLCDILTYIFTALCIIATFAALQEQYYSTAEELGRIFSLLFCFGLASLPLVYLFSYLFQVPSSGFTKMTFINILLGVVVFILIHFFKDFMKEYDVYFLHTIMLIYPLYSFSAGLRDVVTLQGYYEFCVPYFEDIEACATDNSTLFTSIVDCVNTTCHKQGHELCCDLPPHFYDFKEPGIGKNILISCIVSIVLFAILLAIDFRFFEIIFNKFRNRHSTATDVQDDIDVAKEKAHIRDIVQRGEITKHDLIMRDMTKYYKKLLAVNNICLGVDRYECFGLLGINGAGKTTTFKMMTGDIKPSSGDAWVCGLNLKSNMTEVNKLIGYCPQFDALLDDLTCWETLLIFGLLRGITLKDSRILAKQLAKDFDFTPHLHKKVKQMSGGNKRKLSTALALIGDPLVIYLDEPTTGMDPATKRYLWNALCKIRNSGKCIILTSHSMEECEALCTRLAIMVNGNFKCIGSTQHLKSRFSEGYTLTIRIKKPENPKESTHATVKGIENYVTENFNGIAVRENYRELLTFFIADRSQPWSKMFEIMERAKRTFDLIEDYSLGQSSLEQVFLSFTKYQQYS